MKFENQATYIGYVIPKQVKFVQISINLLKFLFTEDSLKIKKPGTSF